MSGWKVLRILTSESVRRVCIKHGWYNSGNNAEYSNLLDSVNEFSTTGKNLTMAKVKQYAKNIHKHTLIDGYPLTVRFVAEQLLNEAYYSIKD